MIALDTSVRSLRLLVLITVAVLAGALWVVGTHHHAPWGGHTCAVCTIAHAPSTIDVAATGVAAPRSVRTRVIECSFPAPVPVAFGIASSRAPPRG